MIKVGALLQDEGPWFFTLFSREEPPFHGWLKRAGLRCPETLFISHENAYFRFSALSIVQGETKTPKIIGCWRANFAFLPDLRIGTFRGKRTLGRDVEGKPHILFA